jgi:DNA mismatch repair ATPase MutL
LDNRPIHDIIHLVSELVDDALDAGATDFRISSEGAWSVSVQDNGYGISDNVLAKLQLPLVP